MQSLGNYTFGWNPDNMTMPYKDKVTAEITTHEGSQIFEWGATIVGKEITLEWSFLELPQWNGMRSKYLETGTVYIWDPDLSGGTTYNVTIKSMIGKYFRVVMDDRALRRDVKVVLSIRSVALYATTTTTTTTYTTTTTTTSSTTSGTTTSIEWWKPDDLDTQHHTIVSGALEDVYLNDGNKLTLPEEQGGMPGFTYTFKFGSGAGADVPGGNMRVLMDLNYNGNPGHKKKASVYDFNLADEVALTGNTDDFPHNVVEQAYVFEVPQPWADKVSNGEMRIQLNHGTSGNDAHQLIIDRIILETNTSTTTTTTTTSTTTTTTTT